MGNQVSNGCVYSVPDAPTPSTPEKDNRSCIRRNPICPSEIIDNLQEPLENAWDVFMMGHGISKHARCMGRRRFNADGHPGPFLWRTYEEVRVEILRVGSSLVKRDVCKAVEFPKERCQSGKRMKILGVFMVNCPEWLMVEQIGNAYGFVLVPLYETLGIEAMRYIINQTRMPVVVVSESSMDMMKELLPEMHCISTVIVVRLKATEEVFKQKMAEWNMQFKQKMVTWDELYSETDEANILPVADVKGSDMQTICYTSGTTGNPKGVMCTHGAFRANIAGLMRGPFTQRGIVMDNTHVHISYLPLAHILERVVSGVLLACGACIGFYRGDAMKLLEDVQLLRPTIFVSVPRLFCRIDERIQNGIRLKSGTMQTVFKRAMRAKISQLRITGSVHHALWDRLVFEKTKQILGGRVKFLISGGAALESHVEERMQIMFCTPLIQGYGLTETLGAATVTLPSDPVKGHVGGPTPCAEICLESVPDLGYRATARPPCGEILIRGSALFSGYFLAPELTDEVLESDGWFHTGDVGILLPNGAVKLIDRKKNLFKLSQGEYIAPERIEGVYAQATYVSQLYVYGNPHQSYLVALVVPDIDAAKLWWRANRQGTPTMMDLVGDAGFKKVVAADMEVSANRAQLKGFEKVKLFKLHDEGFTVENNLLTPTLKMKRNIIRDKFQEQLEALYQ